MCSESLIFDLLPAEDVLFKYIYPKLGPEDWLTLMNVNTRLRQTITAFLRENKILIVKPMTHIEPISFKLLTDDSSNLRYINLFNCSWVTDDLLEPVLRYNKKLNQIDLSYCHGLTEGILQVLTVQCLFVTQLSLVNCLWLTPQALEYMAYYRGLKKQVRNQPNTEDILQAMGKGLRTNLSANTKSKYRGKDKFYHDLQ